MLHTNCYKQWEQMFKEEDNSGHSRTKKHLEVEHGRIS